MAGSNTTPVSTASTAVIRPVPTIIARKASRIFFSLPMFSMLAIEPAIEHSTIGTIRQNTMLRKMSANGCSTVAFSPSVRPRMAPTTTPAIR